ncbi:MAG: polysaccharide pyruvyl transferase CsaB [Candidatus Bipolaricaulota bacterium]|nr:polysaccharide pyruvyl transferase CsaB [Candidatus Bipolaricaulota bacterium]
MGKMFERGKKRLVIVGYYGYGNLGDEAIRVALRAALNEREGLRPVWLVSQPQGTNEVNRAHPLAIFAGLHRSAALILGGGGLLQNKTSARSLLYYLSLILLARSLRRPVFLLGQGIGPINGRFAQVALRFALSKARYIGCRDRGSLDFVQSLGLDGKLGGDLFFLTPPWGEPLEEEHEREVQIVLSLKGGGNVTRFVTLLEEIHARRNVSFTFLPFFPAEDRSLAESIVRQFDSPCRIVLPNSVEEASAELARADLLISSRLHPLEFALRTGTPMLAITEDPKVERFVEEVALHGGPRIPYTTFPSAVEVLQVLDDPPDRAALRGTYRRMHEETRIAVASFIDRLESVLGACDD